MAIIRSMNRLRELFAGVCCLVLAVVVLWPLHRLLGTGVIDPGDPYLVTWILDWNWWAVSHRLPLFEANILHPARSSLAFSEHMFGIAMFGFPLRAAGAGPLVTYNLLTIFSFAFAAYGAWRAAYALTRSAAGAATAAVLFALVPFRFDHLSHIQHLWSGWLPLLVLAVVYLARNPGWKAALLFALVFVLNGLANVHFLIFSAVACALTLPLVAAMSGTAHSGAFLKSLALSAAVSMLVLVPFLIPYLRVSREYQMKRSRGENITYSATLGDWVIPGSRTRVYAGSELAGRARPERALFPGLVALVLGAGGFFLIGASRSGGDGPPPLSSTSRPPAILVAGVFIFIVLTARWSLRGDWPTAVFVLLACLLAVWPLTGNFRRRFPPAAGPRWPPGWIAALIWTLVGFAGSFGLNGFFHAALYRIVPLMSAIRVPARWAMISYTGLALLAAYGVAAIAQRLPQRMRWLAVAFPLLAAAELRPVALAWYEEGSRNPAAYSWLASQTAGGALLELPMGTDLYRELEYTYRSTTHHMRLFNGASGFEPPTYREFAHLFKQPTVPDAALHQLASVGCTTILVHADWLGDQDAAIRQWLARELARGRIEFRDRFDHGVEGDYLFTIVRAGARSAGSPEPHDRAALQTFLRTGGPTANDDPFGVVESPHGYQGAEGALRVAGWVASPNGIASIRLRFQNGRVVRDVAHHPRPDVRQRFPWYRDEEVRGFDETFANPFAHLSRDTSVQVEFLDGSGARTRLATIPVRWERSGEEPTRWKPDAIRTLVQRAGADPVLAERLIRNEITVQQVTLGLARNSAALSDAEFSRRAYQVLLAREPDPEGFASCVRLLGQGLSRQAIVDSILASEEFARLHIER